MLPCVTHVGTGKEQYFILYLGSRPLCRTAPEFFRYTSFTPRSREERELREEEYCLPMVGADEFLELLSPSEPAAAAAADHLAALLLRCYDGVTAQLTPRASRREVGREVQRAEYAALTAWAAHAVRFALSLRR